MPDHLDTVICVEGGFAIEAKKSQADLYVKGGLHTAEKKFKISCNTEETSSPAASRGWT